MPMFTFYCDDSGTHSASDVAIAGCYIATVEQWGELKRNWDEIDTDGTLESKSLDDPSTVQ
jgi:hypothetical protein